MPLISIIVPVYNVESYLKRCIDSIQKQTLTDFELILVDDGSPDNCGNICDEYAVHDNRIHVIHKENGGLSDARNAGIDWVFENSNSEWITFIDSDDWIHCKYLEELYNAVCRTGAQISICGYQQIKDDELNVHEIANVELWDTEEYYCKHHVNATVAWGKLYKRECFRNIRYPKGKLHEDEFVTYKLLFMFKSVAVIQSPLYAYYINSDGIMKSSWSPKRLHALEAYEERIKWFRKRKMVSLYSWTVECFAWHIYSIRKKIIEGENEEIVKKYVPVLKNSLRKILILHNKTMPIEKNMGLYELAFPFLVKIYWYYKAFIRKIG